MGELNIIIIYIYILYNITHIYFNFITNKKHYVTNNNITIILSNITHIYFNFIPFPNKNTISPIISPIYFTYFTDTNSPIVSLRRKTAGKSPSYGSQPRLSASLSNRRNRRYSTKSTTSVCPITRRS